jgi:hypothetical protein
VITASGVNITGVVASAQQLCAGAISQHLPQKICSRKQIGERKYQHGNDSRVLRLNPRDHALTLRFGKFGQIAPYYDPGQPCGVQRNATTRRIMGLILAALAVRSILTGMREVLHWQAWPDLVDPSDERIEHGVSDLLIGRRGAPYDMKRVIRPGK